MVSRETHFNSLLSANSADGGAQLRGIRSVQKPTLRHDDSSFSDFLSAINPLQHIPVVSQLYQNATGDTPSPVASMVGAAILGGPIGFAVAAVNAVFQEAIGKNVLEAVIAPEPSAAPKNYAAYNHHINSAHRPDLHLFETA